MKLWHQCFNIDIFRKFRHQNIKYDLYPAAIITSCTLKSSASSTCSESKVIFGFTGLFYFTQSVMITIIQSISSAAPQLTYGYAI